MNKLVTKCEVVESNNPEDFKYWIEVISHDYGEVRVIPISGGILILYETEAKED